MITIYSVALVSKKSATTWPVLKFLLSWAAISAAWSVFYFGLWLRFTLQINPLGTKRVIWYLHLNLNGKWIFQRFNTAMLLLSPNQLQNPMIFWVFNKNMLIQVAQIKTLGT